MALASDIILLRPALPLRQAQNAGLPATPDITDYDMQTMADPLYASGAFDETVTGFVFPLGCTCVRGRPREPSFHCFGLTDGDGDRSHGYCITFDVAVSEFELRSSSFDAHGRQRRRASSAADGALSRGRAASAAAGAATGDDDAAGGVEKRPETIYCARAIVMLTRWPQLRAFKRVLSAAYRLREDVAALRGFFQDLMAQCPPSVPPGVMVHLQLPRWAAIPNRGSVDVLGNGAGGGDDGAWLTIYAPSLLDLPMSGFPLNSLLTCVDVGSLLTIMSCLLLERKVLVVSTSLTLVTSATESLLGLMYPFAWSHVYVPLLPRALMPYLSAPMPFLIGMDARLLEEARESAVLTDDVLIVDLDHQRVMVGDDAPPPLPVDAEELRELSAAILGAIFPQLLELDSLDAGSCLDAPSEADVRQSVRVVVPSPGPGREAPGSPTASAAAAATAATAADSGPSGGAPEGSGGAAGAATASPKVAPALPPRSPLASLRAAAGLPPPPLPAAAAAGGRMPGPPCGDELRVPPTAVDEGLGVRAVMLKLYMRWMRGYRNYLIMKPSLNPASKAAGEAEAAEGGAGSGAPVPASDGAGDTSEHAFDANMSTRSMFKVDDFVASREPVDVLFVSELVNTQSFSVFLHERTDEATRWRFGTAFDYALEHEDHLDWLTRPLRQAVAYHIALPSRDRSASPDVAATTTTAGSAHGPATDTFSDLDSMGSALLEARHVQVTVAGSSAGGGGGGAGSATTPNPAVRSRAVSDFAAGGPSEEEAVPAIGAARRGVGSLDTRRPSLRAQDGEVATAPSSGAAAPDTPTSAEAAPASLMRRISAPITPTHASSVHVPMSLLHRQRSQSRLGSFSSAHSNTSSGHGGGAAAAAGGTGSDSAVEHALVNACMRGVSAFPGRPEAWLMLSEVQEHVQRRYESALISVDRAVQCYTHLGHPPTVQLFHAIVRLLGKWLSTTGSSVYALAMSAGATTEASTKRERAFHKWVDQFISTRSTGRTFRGAEAPVAPICEYVLDKAPSLGMHVSTIARNLFYKLPAAPAGAGGGGHDGEGRRSSTQRRSSTRRRSSVGILPDSLPDGHGLGHGDGSLSDDESDADTSGSVADSDVTSAAIEALDLALETPAHLVSCALAVGAARWAQASVAVERWRAEESKGRCLNQRELSWLELAEPPAKRGHYRIPSAGEAVAPPASSPTAAAPPSPRSATSESSRELHTEGPSLGDKIHVAALGQTSSRAGSVDGDGGSGSGSGSGGEDGEGSAGAGGPRARDPGFELAEKACQLSVVLLEQLVSVVSGESAAAVTPASWHVGTSKSGLGGPMSASTLSLPRLDRDDRSVGSVGAESAGELADDKASGLLRRRRGPSAARKLLTRASSSKLERASPSSTGSAPDKLAGVVARGARAASQSVRMSPRGRALRTPVSVSAVAGLSALDVAAACEDMSSPLDGVEVKDRSFLLRRAKDTFVAREAVSWLVDKRHATVREAGVALCRRMEMLGLIRQPGGACEVGTASFKDGKALFQFTFAVPAGRRGAKVSELLAGHQFEDAQRSVPMMDFCAAVTALQHVHAHLMPESDAKTAFWLNVYNMLCLHARTVAAAPSSVRERVGFFRNSYNIGGMQYSAMEIEHAVLRAAAVRPNVLGSFLYPKFSGSDRRRAAALSTNDKRVNFALSATIKAMPQLRVYHAGTLDVELQHAAQAFLAASVDIHPTLSEIVCPAFPFSTQMADFAPSLSKLPQALLPFLPEEQVDIVNGMLAQESQIKVRFRSFGFEFLDIPVAATLAEASAAPVDTGAPLGGSVATGVTERSHEALARDGGVEAEDAGAFGDASADDDDGDEDHAAALKTAKASESRSPVSPDPSESKGQDDG